MVFAHVDEGMSPPALHKRNSSTARRKALEPPADKPDHRSIGNMRGNVAKNGRGGHFGAHGALLRRQWRF
jgi:hypothetical protein